MEAARLEAERATAKSSAEQLRGLEHAMRGDREQKLQLIDRYTQEAAELEKTLQAEQDKLAGRTPRRRPGRKSCRPRLPSVRRSKRAKQPRKRKYRRKTAIS